MEESVEPGRQGCCVPVVEHGGEPADQVVGVLKFRAVVEESVQALGGIEVAFVRAGDDPAGGLARGRWALAGLVEGQPTPQRCDGHLHALVVPEVALGSEFLVQDLRIVFSLVHRWRRIAGRAGPGRL
ncbi:hypothetical protein TPA0910_13320 [Streptomyces hygroscopicus subsp. sporocinereus]|uniref:Uncharacterized protein n=1 Tax=Streptomyces hygroscopicus TaxID=1912 RepID=A0ABQ3TU89_STRHY|nr:hypothetical protein TPA0910_13320 [Streptomyces hygroscopicus]